MVMISRQHPPEPPLPEGYRRRVVVKLLPGASPPDPASLAAELNPAAAAEWNALRNAHPGLALERYFTRAPVRGQEASARAEVFERYYAVVVPAGADAEAIARVLDAHPAVDVAYAEGLPSPPPLNPDDDPRAANQGYLGDAPAGIGARWAWSLADGSGVGVVDMEQGWTLDHEDLAGAGITLISGENYMWAGHGTAVLGELVAVDNTLGGIGIAPGATARVVSQWRAPATYNTAEAILSAADNMAAGDVLLLEAQVTYAAYVRMPAEVEDASFDAIQYAVGKGIVVVEAAGNGGKDLDAFANKQGKQVLNRDSADFRDSGAIMVGAASSAVPHQRLAFSNHGSRVDCYGWGENIDTCGNGETGKSTTEYTTTFGGTSGASPMVAGAALLLQSYRVKRGQARYTPAEMRQTLSNPMRNTRSADPPVDRIGVMPNLQGILQRSRPRGYGPLAWAWLILLGGLLITPGGVLCIKCGPGAPGYLGDAVINILGVISIGVGIAGIARGLGARAAE
jgi:subtilisin family serine protease